MSGSTTSIPDVSALLAMHVEDLVARTHDELNTIRTVTGRGSLALRQAAADRVNAYSGELDRRLKASEAARKSATQDSMSAEEEMVRVRRDIEGTIGQVTSALQMAAVALDLSHFLSVHLDFMRRGEHIYELMGHEMLVFTLNFAANGNPYGTITIQNKLTGGRSYTYSLGHGGLARETFLIIGGLCGHMVTEENLPPRLRSKAPSDAVAPLEGDSARVVRLLQTRLLGGGVLVYLAGVRRPL